MRVCVFTQGVGVAKKGAPFYAKSANVLAMFYKSAMCETLTSYNSNS